jgi:hypothetical protein
MGIDMTLAALYALQLNRITVRHGVGQKSDEASKKHLGGSGGFPLGKIPRTSDTGACGPPIAASAATDGHWLARHPHHPRSEPILLSELQTLTCNSDSGGGSEAIWQAALVSPRTLRLRPPDLGEFGRAAS